MHYRSNVVGFITATLAVFAGLFVDPARSDTTAPAESFVISGPIFPLTADALGQSDLAKEPYRSGSLSYDDAESLLMRQDRLNIRVNGKPEQRPTIIHILQWSDSSHTTVSFQKWYLYDPRISKNGGFYAISNQQLFEDTFIPGEKNFRLVFIHLSPGTAIGKPASLNDSFTDATHQTLKQPISYTIDITKEDSQLKQDVQALAGILGLIKAPAAPPVLGAPPAPVYVGYYGWADFDSGFSTSSIKITPATDGKASKTSAKGDQANNKASANLASTTYTNEAPSYVGLSIAVPVTSYKDVTYQSTTTSLVPTTVSKQTAYANLDLYYPAALPGLMALRYIPHPFIGLPLSGKVLEHPMAGIGIGFPWLEIYAAAVFDTENGSVNGTSKKLTIKGSFGVKISVSAAAAALKSSTGK